MGGGGYPYKDGEDAIHIRRGMGDKATHIRRGMGEEAIHIRRAWGGGLPTARGVKKGHS